MPQSLHVLSAHIIFSTKGRQPWLTQNIREGVWAYQSRILQNLECNSITIGGAADHVTVLCNLTKKFRTAKSVEILKKDSSKFIKTLGVPTFTGKTAMDSSVSAHRISRRSGNTFSIRKNGTNTKHSKTNICAF